MEYALSLRTGKEDNGGLQAHDAGISIKRMEIQHLREAMPYDTIRFSLYKGNNGPRPVTLFHVYKVENRSEQKIAFGEVEFDNANTGKNGLPANNQSERMPPGGATAHPPLGQ